MLLGISIAMYLGIWVVLGIVTPANYAVPAASESNTPGSFRAILDSMTDVVEANIGAADDLTWLASPCVPSAPRASDLIAAQD